MKLNLKPWLRLCQPLALLLLAGYLLEPTALLDGHYLNLVKLLPYGIFAGVLALAHYFNRARFFAAGLLMGLVYWLIQHFLQSQLQGTATIHLYTALSLFLPPALLILLLAPERGLWNRHGLLICVIAPLLMACAYGLYPFLSAKLLAISDLWFSIKPFSSYIISINASAIFALCLLLGLLLLIRRDTAINAALCACLLFSFATLAFFDQALISSLMFSGAAITLLTGLLTSSFEMAYNDDLTGLLGRRALNEKLRNLTRTYTIAMLDIDHFKKFNDSHGHDVGDQVLKIVASHIAAIDGGGLAYRYGGEEFCVIFNGKHAAACSAHLEALREAIAAHSITLRDHSTRPKSAQEGALQRGTRRSKPSVSVTISIGMADNQQHQATATQVLKQADRALYRAKQQGRNCLMT